MRRDSGSRIVLTPDRDVIICDGRMGAETDDPWVKLVSPPLRWRGRFIEITFRASLLDEPARPVFRFWLRDGSFADRIGAAPVAGAGVWTGRLPTEVTGIGVSPTNRRGPFDFLIENIRPVQWLELLARGFKVNRRSARSALLTRIIGWKPESDVNLKWSTSSVPLDNYPVWSADRERPFEPAHLDRPRFDWSMAVPMTIVVPGHDKAEVHRTLTSVLQQHFPHWKAIVSVNADALVDPRVTKISETGIVSHLRNDPDRPLICVLRSGEILVPHALAFVAEQVYRHPAQLIFYGDVLQVSAAGTTTPQFQPGWSPRLQAAGGYLMPPFFVRSAETWGEALKEFVETGTLPASWTSRFSGSDVKPLRRVLAKTQKLAVARRPTEPCRSCEATATIIVPTKDQPVLLSRVVSSIKARSPPGRFQILILDNGSTTLQTKVLRGRLSREPNVCYMDRPGAFDFSAMCNEAAGAARSDVLIFLNDDTEVLSEDWLERLVGLAMDPRIGAVGAKLTYPDGRLQHIGVVAGLGESAGHFGAFDSEDAPGWAGRNQVLHEVSAVTGACLAVASHKFQAVGGFDAEHFPVELSDIDLCLKLNAKGWQTVVEPAVHLLHHESASRGRATFRRLDIYERQRAVFVDRWRHVLRDDPFFHPGLSLYSWRAALG